MKLVVNLGDELKNAKITHKPKLPVISSEGDIIGEAIIQSDNKTAELNLSNLPDDSKLKNTLENILELGVGGRVISKDENNVITKFDIMEASIKFKGGK